MNRSKVLHLYPVMVDTKHVMVPLPKQQRPSCFCSLLFLFRESVWLSRYGVKATGWTNNRVSTASTDKRSTLLWCVQKNYGAQLFSGYGGSLPWEESSQSMKRTAHHHPRLVSMLRMSGIVPPLPYMSSFRAQGQLEVFTLSLLDSPIVM
jgi:hypothetical protein